MKKSIILFSTIIATISVGIGILSIANFHDNAINEVDSPVKSTNDNHANEKSKELSIHKGHNHIEKKLSGKPILNNLESDFISDFKITNSDLSLINPIFSHDGKFVLATAEHNLGIYILNSNTLELVDSFLTLRNVGSYLAWHSNNREIIFREKNEKYLFETFSFDIETKQLKKLDIPHNYLTCIGFDGNLKDVVYLNNKMDIERLFPDGRTEIIATNPYKYYHLIRNSNSNILVAHSQNNIILIDIDKKEQKNIETGLASSISKDNRYIFFHKDFEGEHNMIGSSEMYMYDIVNGESTALTSNNDLVLLFPKISPCNKRILFLENQSEKIVLGNFEYK